MRQTCRNQNHRDCNKRGVAHQAIPLGKAKIGVCKKCGSILELVPGCGRRYTNIRKTS